jgi:hypothetical protein
LKLEAVYLQVATGPESPGRGFLNGVSAPLEDPGPDLLNSVHRFATVVRPGSETRAGASRSVVLNVGWPTLVGDTVVVPVDQLCWRGCSRGYVVYLRQSENGWRMSRLGPTWVS